MLEHHTPRPCSLPLATAPLCPAAGCQGSPPLGSIAWCRHCVGVCTGPVQDLCQPTWAPVRSPGREHRAQVTALILNSLPPALCPPLSAQVWATHLTPVGACGQEDFTQCPALPGALSSGLSCPGRGHTAASPLLLCEAQQLKSLGLPKIAARPPAWESYPVTAPQRAGGSWPATPDQATRIQLQIPRGQRKPGGWGGAVVRAAPRRGCSHPASARGASLPEHSMAWAVRGAPWRPPLPQSLGARRRGRGGWALCREALGPVLLTASRA